jgi:hypothetical protein
MSEVQFLAHSAATGVVLGSALLLLFGAVRGR